MKEKSISFRLSDELFMELEFKAKSCNLKPSEYLRQSISNIHIKENNSKDVQLVLGSINRIGNNINQIAKVLNIANNSNKLSDINYDNIIDKLVIIEEQMNTILKGI